MIVHNKHEGCYDFQFYQDEAAKVRVTSITINPPKIFMFSTREEAQDFFEEYINDIDCIDVRCKRGEEVEHVDYCTCGIIELDEEDNPIFFYNRKNQIFLMEQLEHGPKMFVPPAELKSDIKNMNLTNRLIRNCVKLTRAQRNRYIALGKYCEDCNASFPEELENMDDLVQPPKPHAPISQYTDRLTPHASIQVGTSTLEKPPAPIPSLLPADVAARIVAAAVSGTAATADPDPPIINAGVSVAKEVLPPVANEVPLPVAKETAKKTPRKKKAAVAATEPVV